MADVVHKLHSAAVDGNEGAVALCVRLTYSCRPVSYLPCSPSSPLTESDLTGPSFLLPSEYIICSMPHRYGLAAVGTIAVLVLHPAFLREVSSAAEGAVGVLEVGVSLRHIALPVSDMPVVSSSVPDTLAIPSMCQNDAVTITNAPPYVTSFAYVSFFLLS